MYMLTCDRPRYLRVYGGEYARRAEKLFSCPIVCRNEGEICQLSPSPCEVYVAGAFEDFASIAARTGRDGAKLAAFNGGAVYPSRTIFLY